MKKIVLKVSINCNTCKIDIMKAITKLTGIDKVSVDAEKDLVTVIGDVDPVLVAQKVRKGTGKVVEVISVGPPKPEEPEKKKPNTPYHYIPLPICCNDCQYVAVSYAPYGSSICTIL